MKAVAVVVSVFLVCTLLGCGGGGGGGGPTPPPVTIKPARLAVGNESTYLISGTVNDGVRDYRLSGYVVYRIESSGVPPMQGCAVWYLRCDGYPLLDGVALPAIHTVGYIGQGADGAIFEFGGEPWGQGEYVSWTQPPVVVPSPYCTYLSWAWRATRADATVVVFGGTMTGGEEVSTPVGRFMAYRITHRTTTGLTVSQQEWWMSPDYPQPVLMTEDMSTVYGDGIVEGQATYTLYSHRGIPTDVRTGLHDPPGAPQELYSRGTHQAEK